MTILVRAAGRPEGRRLQTGLAALGLGRALRSSGMKESARLRLYFGLKPIESESFMSELKLRPPKGGKKQIPRRKPPSE